MRSHQPHENQSRARRRAQAALVALLAASAAPQALAALYRYAVSSNRIYIEGGGTATLTSLKNNLPEAPLTLIDVGDKTWKLDAYLIIEDGTKLVLHGDAAGGDVNELRLKSANSGSNPFIYVSAEYGTLDVASTKIRSWDPAADGPDTNYGNGRAFIRVRSFMDVDGVTPRESRMDIVDSDISYLGYNAAESYGLVWKVLGGDTDFSMYDKVQVRGDITDSHIYHNYYGVYTFGLQSAQWINNEVDHNAGYGFDPHDDSDDLLIEGNDVHDNGNHGIIASKRCDHVIVRNNDSWRNTGNGIMLHRSSDDGLVENNRAHDNTDSGIAIFATWRTTIRDNVLLDNGNAGIRLSMGASDSVVENNQIDGSGKYGIYFYRGTDTPEPGDDGRNKGNTFTGNVITQSAADGLKITDSDDTTFIGNTMSDNGDTVTIESTTNTRFGNNDIPANGLRFDVSGTPSIPSVVKFSEQPRIVLELESNGSAQFLDSAGTVFDTRFPLFNRVVGPAPGTLLDLDSSNFNGPSAVVMRDFRAMPVAGAVRVNLTKWELTGQRQKGWKSRVEALGTKINFRIGDLAAGVSYDVFRGPVKIKTLTADGAGRIAFSMTPTSTVFHAFTVKPAP